MIVSVIDETGQKYDFVVHKDEWKIYDQLEEKIKYVKFNYINITLVDKMGNKYIKKIDPLRPMKELIVEFKQKTGKSSLKLLFNGIKIDSSKTATDLLITNNSVIDIIY